MKNKILKSIVIFILIFSISLCVNYVLADEEPAVTTAETTAEPVVTTPEPTEAPTAKPEPEEVVTPTEKPTAEPTEEPVVATPEPTEAPTVKPTEQVTKPEETVEQQVEEPEPQEEKSSSSSSGYTNIQLNTVVKSENGKEDLTDLGIKSLKVEAIDDKGNKTAIDISPKFSVNTYAYECKIENDVQSLELTAELISEDWKAEIVGNKILKDGENIITILAYNEDKSENITYQINASRSDYVKVENNTAEKKAKAFKIDKIGILIICATVIISCIIIIFIVRTFKKQEVKNKKHSRIKTEGKNE